MNIYLDLLLLSGRQTRAFFTGALTNLRVRYWELLMSGVLFHHVTKATRFFTKN